MRTGMELEHEQLVKGVNKCKLKKNKLLVECLIGTGKKKRNIYYSKYIICGK